MAPSEFNRWVGMVDAAIERQVGLSLDELPDSEELYEWWEDGMRASTAARQLIAFAGGPV